MQEAIPMAQILRHQIEKKGISQSALAKQIGVRNSTLHGYLYGVCPKGLNSIIKLAEALNMGLDELILGKRS